LINPQDEFVEVDAYAAMGFTKFESNAPSVEATRWRNIQTSELLEDIRARILLRRDQPGAAILDQGYVVGWVPALTLGAEETERLLCTLTLGITHGCRTTREWQEARKTL
jgi:hypothetical protein